ncbi:MAG: (2Fe-2S) ferredoxin domain-containing protein [Merismopedia sp. SIO2A8]|nr:(2Fe-2S) ferredoxin domain-containing protein [Merismopedia sp. SIO2A8]
MSKSTLPPSRFSLEGRFLGFASGKKTPFKYLMVMGPDGETYIKLRKSLRMMLFRYLVPGDWVQIVGQQKWDSDNDALSYKADEVMRISAPTDITLDAGVKGDLQKSVTPTTNGPQNYSQDCSSNLSGTQHPAKQGKKDKILICQKSSCRKRGATVVGQMVERSLSRLGLSEQVTVKYTGCMDRCKAGPNMVFMPSKAKYSRVEPGMVDTLVQQHCVAHFPVQN